MHLPQSSVDLKVPTEKAVYFVFLTHGDVLKSCKAVCLVREHPSESVRSATLNSYKAQSTILLPDHRFADYPLILHVCKYLPELLVVSRLHSSV